MSKPAVREFSKDSPCTKADIWECFRGPSGYLRVQVDVVYSRIGKSVPRVLERDGKAVRLNTARGDFYELTDFGRDWLDKGIRNFLKNHPYRRSELSYPPDGGATTSRVRRVRR